jgi:hypothetical protein
VTAFTDPLMLMWLLVAALAALRRQWVWCGLWWGLALATKQDAILVAPLLAGMAWAMSPGGRRWRPLAAIGLGVAGPVLAVAMWTLARPQPDFLSASWQNYGALTLVAGDRLAGQASAWLDLMPSVAPGILLIGGAAAMVAMRRADRRSADFWLPICASLWLIVHVIVSFPAWDRYALPLAPVAAIWLARMGIWWYDRLRVRPLQIALATAWALCLLLPARAALAGEIRVARDFDRHAGIDVIGDYFWKTDTSATVLYVRDLSWEVDYYTFGRELDRRWFPDVETLAADAAHMRNAKRYIVLADWEASRAELAAALAADGLSASPVLVTTRADGHPALYLLHITPSTP